MNVKATTQTGKMLFLFTIFLVLGCAKHDTEIMQTHHSVVKQSPPKIVPDTPKENKLEPILLDPPKIQHTEKVVLDSSKEKNILKILTSNERKSKKQNKNTEDISESESGILVASLPTKKIAAKSSEPHDHFNTSNSKQSSKTASTKKRSTKAASTKKRHIKKTARYDKYNGSLWIGGLAEYTPKNFKNFLYQPLFVAQIGVAKSMWNISNYTFFYWGLIFGYGNNTVSPGTTNLSGNVYSWYQFAHEQLLLGYEQSLGTPHVSWFLEAGGAFKQATFGIQKQSSSLIVDYTAYQTFNGVFNSGFNVNMQPYNKVSYLIRAGFNFMIGRPENKVLTYNGQNLNVNPITYGPFFSIVIRK